MTFTLQHHDHFTIELLQHKVSEQQELLDEHRGQLKGKHMDHLREIQALQVTLYSTSVMIHVLVF
jgi:hypothetical protein